MDNIQTDIFLKTISDIDKRVSNLERASQPQLIDWNNWNVSLFSYVSDNLIAVNANVAVGTYFQVGDKIKITQTTDKYFYIIEVDTVNNQILLNAGDDYTFTNGAFTTFAISRLANPSGHPLVFDYSTGVQIQTNTGVNVYDDTSEFTGNTKVAKYSMNGSIVSIWYNLGTTSLRAGVISIEISSPFKARTDSADGIWQSGTLWDGTIDSGTDIQTISKWTNTTLLVGTHNTELGPIVEPRSYGVYDTGTWGWADSFTVQI